MATSLQIGKAVFPSVKLASAQADIQHRKTVQCFGPKVAGLGMKSTHLNQKGRLIHSSTTRFGSVLCAAALNARCSASQTQTIQKEVTKINVAPIDNKEKSPELADGGTGFPPRDDDDGGGGGGGGGWKGGFFFFGFLAFLGFMKDNEGEKTHSSNKRRRSLNKL